MTRRSNSALAFRSRDMRSIVPLLLLFVGGPASPAAVDAEPTTVEVIRTIASDPNREHTQLDRRLEIMAVDGALGALETLIGETLVDDPEAILPLLLSVAGMLAEPEDAGAIELLEHVAFERGLGHRRTAMEGLLRIGGSAARSVIDRLPDESDSRLRRKVAMQLWQLRDPGDLAYARATLEPVARADDSVFARGLRGGILQRIEVAEAIASEPTAASTLRHLSQILTGAEATFLTVSGGVAEHWALERMVAAGAPSGWWHLRRYVHWASDEGNGVADHIFAAALVALSQSGRPLSPARLAWLDANRQLLGSMHLTRRAAEITAERQTVRSLLFSRGQR